MSGQVNRASATETEGTGSITRWVKPKTIKIGIHSFLTGDRWKQEAGGKQVAGGSLTRRPKSSFAFSGPRQFVESNVNTITV